MDAKLQDEDLVDRILKRQARLEGKRAPWENIFRTIDERVNPLAGGGWQDNAPASLKGQYNFDATAIEGLDRFTAAIAGITIPRNQVWHSLAVADPELAKLPVVRRWCEHATDRLFAMRYAPHAGFEAQAHEDIRQVGAYGTAPFWVSADPARGFVYKSLHLSECFIDEDFRGRIDTVFRVYKRTARQIAQEFGRDALTEQMRDALTGTNPDREFDLIHAVFPNEDIDPEALDHRGMPVASVHVARAEKAVLRHKGFHSMPIPTSRHVTAPGDVYGRSPAMKVIGTIMGLQQMGRTLLRAAHKSVDPALAFFSDDGITTLVTKPGGANPGMVDENGRLMVQAMPQGTNFPIAVEMIESERAVVRTAFLEEVFKILTDPGDRMTATQVLEMVAKQGVLVAPFAGRHETEKLQPIVERELDLALRHGQIKPMPPEMIEAGGGLPKVEFVNPLARMARAQSAAGLTRLIETLAPLAQTQPDVFDIIDADEAGRGVADVLDVRESWLRSADDIAALRKGRSDAEAAAQGAEQLATVAGASLDLSRAAELQQAA